MPGVLPDPYFAEEQAPHLRPAYLYLIEHEDGTRQQWTSCDRPLTVENLPAELEPSGTVVFAPAQIKHGNIASTDRFEARNVTLAVDSTDERLRRFFLMAAAVKLRCWIIRVATGIEGSVIDFLTQAVIVENGILSQFGFTGITIAAQLTPEPFYVGHSIPRIYCQRMCNHAFGGAGCNVVLDDYKFETEIVSLDPAEKEIVVMGRPVGTAEDHFEAGHFFHDGMKQNFSIVWSEHFVGGDYLFKLAYWHPDFAVGQTLTAYPGCRHTVADCTERFDNAANFGGFPFVPMKNPATNGV